MLGAFKAERLRRALWAALSAPARGGVRWAMLNIYPFILQTLEALRPIAVEIGRHDQDLARQLRRAMSSIALNVAEGSDSRGRNKQARYHSALGSTKETVACLDVGRVLQYIEPPSDELLDRLDRIVRTLAKLSR